MKRFTGRSTIRHQSACSSVYAKTEQDLAAVGNFHQDQIFALRAPIQPKTIFESVLYGVYGRLFLT
nr:hypothetical protein [Cytophagales bacterium]